MTLLGSHTDGHRTGQGWSPLRPRVDPHLGTRLAVSAHFGGGLHLPTAEVGGWMRQRAEAHPFEVRQIPFDGLVGWDCGRAGREAPRRPGTSRSSISPRSASSAS
jgi:hypothetical protein